MQHTNTNSILFTWPIYPTTHILVQPLSLLPAPRFWSTIQKWYKKIMYASLNVTSSFMMIPHQDKADVSNVQRDIKPVGWESQTGSSNDLVRDECPSCTVVFPFSGVTTLGWSLPWNLWTALRCGQFIPQSEMRQNKHCTPEPSSSAPTLVSWLLSSGARAFSVEVTHRVFETWNQQQDSDLWSINN